MELPTKLPVDLGLWIPWFYSTVTLLILFVSMVPALRDRFIAYGVRGSLKPPGPAGSEEKKSSAGTRTHDTHEPRKSHLGDSEVTSGPERLLDWLQTLQVPHSWFLHFYICSVISSLFWMHQFLTNGSALRLVISSSQSQINEKGPSMTIDQVLIVWTLMFIQGCRRLYESVVFSRSSRSQMWIVHYFIGVGFYLVTGVAIWIEALPVLDARGGISLSDFRPAAPSNRTFIFIPIFILASGVQYDCHSYLFSLKQYSVPEHPIFNQIVCPHYSMECLIYLAISLVAAPPGTRTNSTLHLAFMFVLVNLGATAQSTRNWYRIKFGEASVTYKARIIPGVF